MNTQPRLDCYAVMETRTEKSAYASLICSAIMHKQKVRFIYHEKERIGEPQCCGVSTTGKEAVRMHMIKGGSRPEQLFEVAQMKFPEVLNEYFSKPGPNYNPGDSAMKRIYCQL